MGNWQWPMATPSDIGPEWLRQEETNTGAPGLCGMGSTAS
jgi:hypothetical protein